MTAYPGYTIRGIEDELTWREVEELIDAWEDTPPVSVEIARVSSMIQKRWGAKFVKRASKVLAGENLLAHLTSQGYL